MGGGGTTVQQPAPPTPQEIELQELSIQLSQKQLEAIDKQTAFQEEQFAALGPLLEQQRITQEKALAREEELDPIRRELLDLEIEAIRRGPAASPEQKKLIAAATEEAISAGETDIERFRTEGLDALRTELAPSLGLRPGDSPITQRGNRLLAETTRQQGQLVSRLRATQAGAELNFPLAAGAVQAERTGAQQGILTSAQQFMQQLQQQIVQNRLGTTSAGGLGLTGVPFSGTGTLNALAAQRGSTTTTSGGGFGSTLSGIGGILSGGAAVFAASSKKLKKDFKSIDVQEMLKKVNNLSVERWKYKLADGEEHIGPYAEDFTKEFQSGDGVTINIIDALGVLFASVQALTAKIEGLENGTS